MLGPDTWRAISSPFLFFFFFFFKGPCKRLVIGPLRALNPVCGLPPPFLTDCRGASHEVIGDGSDHTWGLREEGGLGEERYPHADRHEVRPCSRVIPSREIPSGEQRRSEQGRNRGTFQFRRRPGVGGYQGEEAECEIGIAAAGKESSMAYRTV
ncbi:hypothetical protein VUR80DRAFT_10092 [Thermomyces stellatus]